VYLQSESHELGAVEGVGAAAGELPSGGQRHWPLHSWLTWTSAEVESIPPWLTSQLMRSRHEWAPPLKLQGRSQPSEETGAAAVGAAVGVAVGGLEVVAGAGVALLPGTSQEHWPLQPSLTIR